jgi:hypothetical protein
MEEKLEITHGRKLEGDRLELYELFRKKHHKGNKEAQTKMCLQIADERIKVYIDIFKEK